MSVSRWKGLKALVEDAVVEASRAIEQVQKRTADRPFAVLALVPGIGEAARGVQVLHDVTLAGVHGTIRTVTRAVGKGLDVALDSLDDTPPSDQES
jgi:hypothetical protein